jgi:hypothetical protein
MGERHLTLPERFSIIAQDYVDFDPVLGWFDWSIENAEVAIDFATCRTSNLQTLSLLVHYVWFLRTRGCRIELNLVGPVADMWSRLGARGWSQVLANDKENFLFTERKPLIAIRTTEDRQYALRELEEYTRSFPIDYNLYLSHIVSEMIYNTLEHGPAYLGNRRIPSLIQFNWYQNRDELSILVADLGIGIKRHLELNYPAFASDVEALQKAIQPETSGTFGQQSSYSTRNNAGMGLYVSSQLMRELRADMWVASGNGQIHVSPLETTTRDLSNRWPGTLVLLNLHLHQAPPPISFDEAQTTLLEKAKEARERETNGHDDRKVISIFNYFGKFAEDKAEAIKFRDRYLLPSVASKQQLSLDFQDVTIATHGFLNALLAGPIRAYSDLGLNPYKYIRPTNETEAIRATILLILDTNT